MELSQLLNPKQLEAATYLDGHLRIIAGAGSGKTRVITYRIAYLIEEVGVNPHNILAITFTNKAANEMKSRIYSWYLFRYNNLYHPLFMCARTKTTFYSHWLSS